jgi:hypothetical protein
MKIILLLISIFGIYSTALADTQADNHITITVVGDVVSFEGIERATDIAQEDNTVILK